MKTRFSLELRLHDDERLRLVQLFVYLAEQGRGTAFVPRELADFLAGPGAKSDAPEKAFAKLIGVEPPGIDIVAVNDGAVRIYDSEGAPNLPTLCQIIANVVPRLLPLEFSFALVDEVEHRFSGGLVVMTASSADIRTIDSIISRRGGVLLH